VLEASATFKRRPADKFPSFERRPAGFVVKKRRRQQPVGNQQPVGKQQPVGRQPVGKSGRSLDPLQEKARHQVLQYEQKLV
jgi:hypothetical protein